MFKKIKMSRIQYQYQYKIKLFLLVILNVNKYSQNERDILRNYFHSHLSSFYFHLKKYFFRHRFFLPFSCKLLHRYTSFSEYIKLYFFCQLFLSYFLLVSVEYFPLLFLHVLFFFVWHFQSTVLQLVQIILYWLYKYYFLLKQYKLYIHKQLII